MKFDVNVLIDGVKMFTLEDDNSVSDLNTLLSDVSDEDVNLLSLELVERKEEKIDEDFDNGVPDVGTELKTILVEKYKFNPSDIDADVDGVVLFNDPEDWEVELSGDEDLDEIAQFLYEQAVEEHKIDENLKNEYKYILRHGFGPGTLPKDVDILDFKDIDNYKTEVILDRPLTKEELEKYDIIFPKIKESYVQDSENEYTIWSSSDIAKEQIPLVKIKTDANGDLFAEAIDDTNDFDIESAKIANNTIASAKKSGKDKDIEYVLTRIDKTLNHNDPFFSLEFDRSITNSGPELFAAQTLRTLRDDLKAAANLKTATEDTIVEKYKELTGVDYYTDEIIDKDQYDQILILLLKDPTDKFNYIYPKENKFIQRTKDLTEDLIEKVLLKSDPDFYKK